MIPDPRQIEIRDYNYPLPDERIAKFPVPKRDESKLLIYDKGHISHDVFKNITTYLEPGSLLVYNNTKVIQARLHFNKDTGALIEVFLLEPQSPCDYEQIFQTRGRCAWICMIGNLKKWKEGQLHRTIRVGENDVTLSVERGEEVHTGHSVTFTWDRDDVSFAEILEAVGELPIPPYLNRKTEESDKQTYQTVYSKIKGSVAAPTAGLHFTPAVLEDVDRHGIEREEVTLHVGAGTFKPVKAEHIEGHEMHREYISVKRHTIERLLAHEAKATTVGTTSVRTLESLYYIGCRLIKNPQLAEADLTVDQWEPYGIALDGTSLSDSQKPADGSSLSDSANLPTTEPTGKESLQAILTWMDTNGVNVLHTATRIIIAPGYRYHIVNRLITNFHQPQSTLLLLVSALIGEDWHRVYDYALANDFRFLSYGDSSLLIP